MVHKNREGKLFPKAPFDFKKSLEFINRFTPAADEQTVHIKSFTKAVYLEDQVLAFKIEDRGQVEEPELYYTFYSEDEINKKIKTELEDRISFYLSLDDDLNPFYAIGNEDKKFNQIIRKLYGLHQVKFLTPFEAASWAVLSQRISMKAAHTMKNNITRDVGDHIEVDGKDYWTFPDASQIKKLGVEKLHSIIKNQRKTEYLTRVAEAFDQVDEKFLREEDIEEVKEWLINIKGIGEWSAHLELIRGLGRMDDKPQHDRTLAKCFRQIYGSDENYEETLERYGNYKGYWAYYMRTTC
ncbi:MAG TPA: hypothetical protein VMC48_03420 [Methanobacterium sp.]|nr:hypothetical protein [Methanobacterium sp.]